jgi:hypothetical protein
MTFHMQRATKRTFYIERRGAEYTLVKTWEAGAEFTQKDMGFLMTHVLHAEPDERIIAEQSLRLHTEPDGRIIAEQSLSVTPSAPGGVVTLQADTQQQLDSAMSATERLLRGERPAEGTG